MANPTLPDVTLSNSAYVDIYAITGIPVGTPLIIQNKSTTSFYVQERETAPSATNIDGNILQSYGFFLVTPTSTTLTGMTWGNSVLVTILLSGTNSLTLTPNTTVRVRVEGIGP